MEKDNLKQIFNLLTARDRTYIKLMINDLHTGDHLDRTDKGWKRLGIDKKDFNEWRNTEWYGMVSNQRIVNDNSTLKQKQMWLYAKFISDSDLASLFNDILKAQPNDVQENKSNDFGVIARGVKLPIIKTGDNIVDIVCDNIIKASYNNNVELKDRDIIAVTESIVARADGNYVSVDDIAEEIKKKFGEEPVVGVLWPIYSRNRFSMILKGIARAAKSVVVQLHNGKDEMGNDLLNPFTDVNIVDFYTNLIEAENAKATIILSDNVEDIAKATNNVIVATIHNRNNDYKKLKEFIELKKYETPIKVYRLDELCNERSDEHGYNTMYGLLGSNKASEEKLKLFPNNTSCATVVSEIQSRIKKEEGVNVEVMIYGDGCFKDPVGGIWEFADPIASPARTSGLEGTPNELKLKYLVDNELAELDGEELKKVVQEKIKEKDNNLVGKMDSQGTTPRKLTDLLASLADLTSGSGDRGTPCVWISGYFSNYSN